MKNEIVHITKERAIEVKKEVLCDADTFFVEIEGAKINTEEDYVREMSKAFKFPCELPSLILGWYNDYINDLMWIKQNSIILLIHDYDLMLKDEKMLKCEIMDDFLEITLPWWEGEVVGHMVGGKPRRFIVYLEH